MNRHLVDYNAIPAPYVAAADPAQSPSQIAEELKKAREAAQARDAEAYKSMTPPAGAAKPREPAYQPEGFDFAYVDSKGHQGETIPARPALDPGRVTPEDVHGEPAALADCPTEWHSGPQPC